MTFKEVITAFLQRQEIDKKLETSVTYKRKIYIFYEYVTIQLQARDVNYISILSAMSLDQLMDSVEYYVNTCNVRYIATVDTYITVLKIFFEFISEEYGWRNVYFESSTQNKEFKSAYDHKVNELHLYTAKQVEPPKKEIIIDLLKACDEKIDHVNIKDAVSGKSNGTFSGYISSIIVKLVLIYGCKNAVINDLKLNDYNSELNKITINGLPVRLPDKLTMQMKEYIKIRNAILKEKNTTDRLFIDVVNPLKKLDNTKMFFILKDVMGTNQATAIAKFSIIQMIKQEIPAHIIKEFTGYADDVYNHCQALVDEEKGILMISEKSKLIDSALRQNNLFDEM